MPSLPGTTEPRSSEGVSSGNFSKSMGLPITIWFRTSGLQSCATLDFCCSRLLGLLVQLGETTRPTPTRTTLGSFHSDVSRTHLFLTDSVPLTITGQMPATCVKVFVASNTHSLPQGRSSVTLAGVNSSSTQPHSTSGSGL